MRRPKQINVRNHPTFRADPLQKAVDALWQEQRRLLGRWGVLRRAETRTPYEEGELRVLEARIFALRARSQRFCTILRDEAWARYELQQGRDVGAGMNDPPRPVPGPFPRVVASVEPFLPPEET